MLGRQVARDHDLLVVVVQRIEGVEERFLRRVLALQELDVVDEQDVDLAVARLKDAGPVVRDRVDEVVRELLARDVPHANARVEALGVVPDRVQEVGLAEPGLPVDEQGVVRLREGLRDGDGRGVGEPVGAADDEVVEAVLGVEPAVTAAPARLARRRGGRLLDVGGRGVGRLEGGLEALVLDLGVHDDREARDVVAGDGREGGEEGQPDALLEHAARELVRHFEVEGARHDAARLDEVDEPVQLRRDALIRCQRGAH